MRAKTAKTFDQGDGDEEIETHARRRPLFKGTGNYIHSSSAVLQVR